MVSMRGVCLVLCSVRLDAATAASVCYNGLYSIPIRRTPEFYVRDAYLS